MIVLKGYNQCGSYIEVTLTCTCGNPAIVEESSKLGKVYICQTCKSTTTLNKLRNESSTQWRSHFWIVRLEKRSEKRLDIEVPVKIDCQAARDKSPMPALKGTACNVSSGGMAVEVTNLTLDFLKIYKNNVCEAEIHFPFRLQKFIPEKLSAIIVYIDYKEKLLPQAKIGLAFTNLSEEAQNRIKDYLKMIAK